MIPLYYAAEKHIANARHARKSLSTRCR